MPLGILKITLSNVNIEKQKICVMSNNLEIDTNDVLENIKFLLQYIISQKRKFKNGKNKFMKKPTPEENALKIALENLGVFVLSQVSDRHKHIDLAIPSAKINIEVDGPKHLTNANQIIKDLLRSHYSDDLGYFTIHIPNESIHSDLDKIAKALAEAAKIREEQLKK